MDDTDDFTRTVLSVSADEAASVALWAFRERAKLSPSIWNWVRRRYLARVWEEKAEESERIRKALDAQ